MSKFLIHLLAAFCAAILFFLAIVGTVTLAVCTSETIKCTATYSKDTP